MSTYTLKSIVRRGGLLVAAFALFAAAVIPAASTYADALNPLTDRSLTLSSSSPGWDYKDGSGNDTYAQPNSGANGQKTGNTFEFKVSTNSSAGGAKLVQGFSFQYCTASAGNCTSPGNNGQTGGVRNADSITNKTSDLNVETASPAEVSAGNFASMINATTGAVTSIPNRDNSQGNFVVMTKDNSSAGNPWVHSTGWTMESSNKEYSGSSISAGTATGKKNYITLVNTTGITPKSGDSVKVIFFGTDTNYITNPGQGAFFVKINDYNADDKANFNDTTLIDGGVTVANVMNQSISIQTKVLETMDFSVGTVDPYTLDSTDTDSGTAGVQSQLKTANGQDQHGQCDPILGGMTPTDTRNTLLLGDTNAENSLSTSKTYSTHSYWRLSSNSSAGATVYYSGVTLKNTVGDEIAAIGTTATAPMRGTPQFGLALANGTIADNGTSGTGKYLVNYSKETDSSKGVYENGADNAVAGIHASVATDIASLGLTGYHSSGPQLYPLIPKPAYDAGAGSVNGGSGEYGTVNTKFAFDANSNLIPAAIASEDSQVVDCVTAKIRYIANIAATTPAGIYTTKINYIAAPQY